MSLNNWIHLFFPVEQMQKAIDVIANRSENGDRRRKKVPFPGGYLTIPFGIEQRLSDHEGLLDGGTIVMLIHPQIKADDSIRAYLATNGLEVPKDPDQLVTLGSIPLYITCGKTYSEFVFAPMIRSLNLLFVESPAIENEYLKILYLAAGVVGLIYMDEERSFAVLGNREQRLINDYWEDCSYWDKRTKTDIDCVVEFMLDDLSLTPNS